MTLILKKEYINIKLKDNYVKHLITLQIYSVFHINCEIINKEFN